ncbi:MAG: ABC transporter permease [Bryobacteraceae bacterium]
METWMQNFRYAFRRLRRSPGFACTVIVTLGLGIGANTAIFSVVYGVLLKPLRFPDAQQLVAIQEGIATYEGNLPVNANHLVFWQRNARSFSGIAALRTESLPLGGGQPEEIGVAQITANLFSVLAVEPRMGRAFAPEEAQPGHNDVVILTDGLWKRRYAADGDVVGKTIVLDGKPYRVAGVLPSSFSLPSSDAMGTSKPVQAFVPFGWSADVLEELEGDHNYFAIGRLKPGATLGQATAELNVLQHSISARTPDKVPLSATIARLDEYLTGTSKRSLVLLLAAVGAVLLIACVNIANLLLTRATGNGHESAVRMALGGTRAQLLWSALAEPIMLCFCGGVLGIVFAALGVPLLIHNTPAEMPRLDEISVNWVALAFAGGISMLAVFVCGILPAWRYAQTEPERALRGNLRTASQSRGGKQLGKGLVVAEVSGSVALVVIAGLFITSMFKLLHVNRGFDAEHVLSAEVVLPDKQYGESGARNAFYERALGQLRQLPGVQAAGVVSVLPLDGDYWGDLISRIGDARPLFERPSAHFRWISPGYFEALTVPLIAGRFLDERDKGKKVAIISKRVADIVWPGMNPIGQKFRRGDPDEAPFEVIGEVGDIRAIDLSKEPQPMVYAPYWYRSREVGWFAVRTRQDPEALITGLRRVMRSIDPQVPVPSIRTMNMVVNGSVAARHFEMQLLLSFAIGALLVAGVGIYGVVSYSAAQRTHEIGIRMAIGAGKSDIYRLIVGGGVAPVVLGTIIGVGLAWAAGRLMAGLLFEVSPRDPMIAAMAGAVLLAVGVLACVVPARRAAKTEPVQALRYE